MVHINQKYFIYYSKLSGPADVDCTVRFWCHRAMMQEPHCLNTSILDCSVTFTVDRDICIHGIEVPSQVTEVPANIELPMLQNLAAQANNQAANAAIAGPAGAGGQPANNNQANSTEYNELLYAHLLDADGNRLTYTHFTAKVHFIYWFRLQPFLDSVSVSRPKPKK